MSPAGIHQGRLGINDWGFYIVMPLFGLLGSELMFYYNGAIPIQRGCDMNYPDAESLGHSFEFTHMLITRLTAGLNHAGSVVQPPFKGNALNWVLGHIVAGRNEALTYLGGEPVWGDEELGFYKTGSDPITGDDQGLTLEQLLAAFDEVQERLSDRLAEIWAEELAKVVDTRFGERPVGEHVASLHWHETYHAGQLELLRELAKKAV